MSPVQSPPARPESAHFTSPLECVYSQDQVERQKERLGKLVREFQRRFPSEDQESTTIDTFIARSPGRVNLIGEHIDYSNYGVLPMALAVQDILIACRVYKKESTGSNVARLRVQNIHDAQFPAREFTIRLPAAGSGNTEADYIAIDPTKHEWSNYFLSGFKGTLQHLHPTHLYEMDCLVDGCVPTGAGVSSSSAFVCCAALCTMHAYAARPTRRELTQLSIVSERFVGVESGGMDQSASVFGSKGQALLIEFYPDLQVDRVPLPGPDSPLVPMDEEVGFVVAHTLVTADKHVTAPVCYNLRVVETRLAALVLGRLMFGVHPVTGVSWEQCLKLRDVQEWYMASGEGKKVSFNEALVVMAGMVERHLTQKEGYRLEECGQLLGMSVDTIKEKYMSKFPVRAEKFQLYKRAKHVFTEALRVHLFKDACLGKSTPPAGKSVAEYLGQLMNESQESCRDLFECSCPELDQLTSVARKHGALGSRLTGAGWGGCTVSLVLKNNMNAFMEGLKKDYYATKKVENYDDVLFATTPGCGAAILEHVW